MMSELEDVWRYTQPKIQTPVPQGDGFIPNLIMITPSPSSQKNPNGHGVKVLLWLKLVALRRSTARGGGTAAGGGLREDVFGGRVWFFGPLVECLGRLGFASLPRSFCAPGKEVSKEGGLGVIPNRRREGGKVCSPHA